jgi:hypothetical protein
VWPDHGGEQGDMAADYPQSIGEKGGLHIDVAMERSAMAKGGECKKEGFQVSNQEGRIKNDNKDTNYLHKRMVGGKEASRREIEDCCEEEEHCNGRKGIGANKRARTEEEGGGSSRAATKSEGPTRRVLPKWCQ